MAKYTTETDHLFQYSQGYRLIVPKAYTGCVTQFYSEDYPNGLAINPTSYTVQGGTTYCPVPNQLLVNANTIIVYAYRLGTDRAITESKTVIPVWERPQPADFVLDPTDTVTYETVTELISDMNSTLDKFENVSASATSGSTASATATLEDDGLEFEFVLPKGDKGDTGNTGVSISTIAFREYDSFGGAVYTITLDNGQTADFTAPKGVQGVQGNTGTIAVGTVTSGSTPSVTNVGTNTAAIFDFVLEKGEQGIQGETGQTGATGNGISSVELVSGTHAAGTTDTYRITFTNGQTTDFTVYNGANGEGAGDMLWENWNAQFNPQNKSGQLALSSEVPTLLSALEDDASHRTVSDTEKDSWDSKASGTHTHVKTDITDLGNASTSAYGLTKLSSSTSSSSTSLAATPSAVRSAYNLANGKYTKPTDGIPKTDLASAVQTSLGLADTSIQTHQDISGKANKPTISSVTMSSSGWSNSEYSFESTYPTATYDVSIELNGDSATDEQIEAWSSAKICGSATSNKAIAKGDTPTVNIPIIVKAVAK